MMNRTSQLCATLFLITIAGCAHHNKSTSTTKASATQKLTSDDSKSFQDKFDVDKSDLTSRGQSKYIILQPHRRAHYASKDGTLIITVLPETKTVDGVVGAAVGLEDDVYALAAG